MVLNSGEDLKGEQILKKIANLKQKVKAKADMKRTGNRPLNLKASEKIFLEILSGEDNPTINPIQFGLEVGVSPISPEEENCEPALLTGISSNGNNKKTPPIKRKFPEESSDINTIQKKVLQNQLELIQMEKK